MAPMVRDEREVLGGADSGNIMVNTLYQYLPRAAVLKIYAVEDGGDPRATKMSVILGNTQELLNGNIPVFGATLGPDTNKHLICEAVAKGGDQVIITIGNSGVAAAATRTMVKIDFI